jgi:hypothetical protein
VVEADGTAARLFLDGRLPSERLELEFFVFLLDCWDLGKETSGNMLQLMLGTKSTLFGSSLFLLTKCLEQTNVEALLRFLIGSGTFQFLGILESHKAHRESSSGSL